jgi:hypothetical protein
MSTIKRMTALSWIAALGGVLLANGCSSDAPKPPAVDTTGPAILARGGPGKPDAGGGGETETAGSNVSFPVIFSDNLAPDGFPLDNAWKFAAITDPDTQCVDESGVTSGTIDPNIVCYYGRHVTVVSETGALEFDGSTKVWWLQKRASNFWKALTVGRSLSTRLAVSAVDIGDLLESTPTIATRQIRTEFNLLQSIATDDSEFGSYVVTDWSTALPSPCALPTAPGQNLGCFAAVGMSGAVPGTEQSGNEAQGTDFGPGAGVGDYPGTRTLLDPTTIRAAVDTSSVAIPIHALVYSRCARLVIQKIEGTPTWDPSTGRWSGPGVGAPVVNVSSYGGTYPTEINSGGGIVYGYNWNAKTIPTGTYRMTFVLDGNDTTGPQCPTTLLTEFKSGVTKLANVGEVNTPHLLFAGDSQLGDEGGLAYLDVAISTKGGGGRGGK